MRKRQQAPLPAFYSDSLAVSTIWVGLARASLTTHRVVYLCLLAAPVLRHTVLMRKTLLNIAQVEPESCCKDVLRENINYDQLAKLPFNAIDPGMRPD